MTQSPHGRGAGIGRRLRRALAVALVLAGSIAPAGTTGGAETRGGALDLHASVVNGTIVGSAFLLEPGIAVTNAHVVRGRRPGERVVLVASRPGGTTVTGDILAISRRMDLALISVPHGFLPLAPRADAPARRGLRVSAAGIVAEPGLPGDRLELRGEVRLSPVTMAPFGPGLVVALPGVRRGFSGGPMLDEAGRLVGMIAALKPGPVAVAASGFAPRGPVPAAGAEAFVLGAAEIRAEARRLLPE